MLLRRPILIEFKIAVFVAAITLAVFFWPLRYIESGEEGISWKPLSGQIGLMHSGWQVEGPLTFVTEVETRPQRVCLTSHTHAAANCRLVQFDDTQVNRFIAVEGWRWYWWSNRFSFNGGYTETYRGFRDVLRGYAFSAQQYPFVKVLETQ